MKLTKISWHAHKFWMNRSMTIMQYCSKLGRCFWTDLVILFGQFVMTKNMYLRIPIAFFERCLRNFNFLLFQQGFATIQVVEPSFWCWWKIGWYIFKYCQGPKRWAGFVKWFPWNFRPRLARLILFKGSLVFQITCHVDATIEDLKMWKEVFAMTQRMIEASKRLKRWPKKAC